MKVVYSDKHALHDPAFFLVRGERRDSAEKPGRADILLKAAREDGHEIVAPAYTGLVPVLAIHTPEYVDFLQVAQREWRALEGAGPEVIPNVHPVRYRGTYPRAIAGRAGWHQVDGACPIGSGTWEAALAAAQVAVTAAQIVMDETRTGAATPMAYALCRPPGHHAYADMAGGFCFLNNTAIAAQHLRTEHQRVAILDIDVHHGNGTQGIFYARSDVLTVSIHADPADYYPFFWGHAHERGEGAGEGSNFNLPLPLGSSDAVWLAAGERALERIRTFAPTALVVALGLDASEHDPLQGLKVTTSGFGRMAALIAALKLPTVLVQEGGYLGPELGDNLMAALRGFSAS
ncbi:histone deacetylase family protein [Reyranella sp. CPCC 100927]|uniref:histone deacetylase family protein n=1 Tax=Reyranella sp. CPCC 100927 TaxID=2599616 RepID=UPI0011B40D3E|nr:histone deacetylase family protein [Reyranella sp. CPCC 100927]TWS99489.1 histone deacetylase family protein [Reyranella sp. CPCC 100927]